jgi:DNA-directed RNA polymerase specialized sigma24 family protein
MTLQHNDAPAAGRPGLAEPVPGPFSTATLPPRSQLCDGTGGSKIDDVSQGDRSASYARFVVASRETLLRVLVAHHGPDIGAESLADAYAYTWEHWDRVATLENPVGYVFRVGDRVGIRRAMKARRESPARGADDTDDTDDRRFVNSGDDLLFGSDLGLRSLLGTLPTRQRAAVLLVHGYGWSYRDAAETMDIPLTTLTNEVTRGLKKLREQMKSETSMDLGS